MKKQINLSELFKDSLCSFPSAKKAKQAGLTCANTFYAYDSKGELSDGGWLETIAGSEMYPAINLPFAIGMLENTDLKFDKIDCYEIDGRYYLNYEKEMYQSQNIINILVDVWINHKTLD